MLIMSSALSKIFSTRNLFIIACLVIIGYLLPYYILGEDTHIRVHHNLDFYIVLYELLFDSEMVVSSPDDTFQQIINGLPSISLLSAFDVVVWLYLIVEPVTAYTINKTIMRFKAYLGMFYLLKHPLIKQDHK